MMATVLVDILIITCSVFAVFGTILTMILMIDYFR